MTERPWLGPPTGRLGRKRGGWWVCVAVSSDNTAAQEALPQSVWMEGGLLVSGAWFLNFLAKLLFPE